MSTWEKCKKLFYVLLATCIVFLLRYIFVRLNTTKIPKNEECLRLENFTTQYNNQTVNKDFGSTYHHIVQIENLNNILNEKINGRIQEKCAVLSWSPETELIVDNKLIASTSYYLLQFRTYISDCHNRQLFYTSRVYKTSNKAAGYRSLEEIYNADTDELIGYLVKKKVLYNEFDFNDINDKTVAVVKLTNEYFYQWNIQIIDPSSLLSDFRLVYLASIQHYFNNIDTSDWCNEISIWINIIVLFWIVIAIVIIVYIFCYMKEDYGQLQLPQDIDIHCDSNNVPLLDKNNKENDHDQK